LLAVLLLTPAGWPLSWLAPLRPLGFGFLGLGLAIVGVAAWQLHRRRSLTVLPSPRADAGLQTGGLYQHVRHPVYSGLLACAGGFAFVAASGRHFLLWGMLWALLTAKSVREERLLTQRFGGYVAYAARTPRFLPRFRGPSLP
jgi:protein-S-isoprenylcysteine O-methyltransferase Ste14